jgi:alpha-tubulin suppressor-like RCC1 family protein
MKWVPFAVLSVHACSLHMPPGSVEPEGDFPCSQSEECPTPPNACLLSQCYDGGCVYVPSPPGILPPNAQKQGDCAALYCDGHGEATEREAPMDGPPDDDNPCTEERCEGGKAVRKPISAGGGCGQGGVCTAAGTCGECLAGAQRCEGAGVVTCGEDGHWSAVAACPAAQPTCIEAKCVGPSAVAAGSQHACALFSGGAVRCWGSSIAGELGDAGVDGAGSLDDLGVESVVRVALGPRHACAVDQGGTLRCWGANDFGQLGDGTFVSQESPVEVELGGVVDVAVGRDHTCARNAGGAVFCWGRNDRGQCGSGKIGKPLPVEPPAEEEGSGQMKPVAIPGLADASALLLLARHTTCVRRVDGSRSCWGMPSYSAADEPTGKVLADHKKVSITKPAAAPIVPDAVQLGCGHDHCCVAKADGSVACWGGNDKGQLGAPGPDRAAPAPVADVAGADRIGTGRTFTCARLRDGGVTCWGANDMGQLGRSGSGGTGLPAAVALPGPARSIAVGDDFACALAADSSVSCWGSNDKGQLGREQPAYGPTPEPVVW